MLARRSFLAFAALAPAIVRAHSLMRLSRIPISRALPDLVPISNDLLDDARWEDFGVFDPATGMPLTRVEGNPNAGQYAFDAMLGTYSFAAADAGRALNWSGMRRSNVIIDGAGVVEQGWLVIDRPFAPMLVDGG